MMIHPLAPHTQTSVAKFADIKGVEYRFETSIDIFEVDKNVDVDDIKVIENINEIDNIDDKNNYR